jgi:hypothetical protein
MISETRLGAATYANDKADVGSGFIALGYHSVAKMHEKHAVWDARDGSRRQVIGRKRQIREWVATAAISCTCGI